MRAARGSWGQTGGQPRRKGRGGLADTSGSERSRKILKIWPKTAQPRQEGVGPPCRRQLPPRAAVRGGAERGAGSRLSTQGL